MAKLAFMKYYIELNYLFLTIMYETYTKLKFYQKKKFFFIVISHNYPGVGMGILLIH